MMDIKPIEYDVDMDRFYIPVNSRYEIQTKGKGSSFRIANTVTHERHLVSCTYVQDMLEDMAKGTHAELMQQQAEITSLRAELEIAKKDGERLDYLDSLNDKLNQHYKTNYGFKLHCSHNVIRIFSQSVNHIDLNDANSGIDKYTKVREAIDNAMKGNV